MDTFVVKDAASVRACQLALASLCVVLVSAAVVSGESPALALLIVPIICFAMFQVVRSFVVVDPRQRTLTIVRGFVRDVLSFDEVVEVGFPAWGLVSVVSDAPRRRWWGGRVRRIAIGVTGTKVNQPRVREMARAVGVAVVSPRSSARWDPREEHHRSGRGGV